MVVDGDIDGSEQVVARLAGDLPVRTLVLPENQGRSAALNAGFGAATGDVLLRSDDDLELADEHLARHAAPPRRRRRSDRGGGAVSQRLRAGPLRAGVRRARRPPLPPGGVRLPRGPGVALLGRQRLGHGRHVAAGRGVRRELPRLRLGGRGLGVPAAPGRRPDLRRARRRGPAPRCGRDDRRPRAARLLLGGGPAALRRAARGRRGRGTDAVARRPVPGGGAPRWPGARGSRPRVAWPGWAARSTAWCRSSRCPSPRSWWRSWSRGPRSRATAPTAPRGGSSHGTDRRHRPRLPHPARRGRARGAHHARGVPRRHPLHDCSTTPRAPIPSSATPGSSRPPSTGSARCAGTTGPRCPLLAAASSRLRVDADVTVVSSSGWAHGFDISGRRLVYCHNPARWLYQADDYLGGRSSRARTGRLALALGAPPLRRWDRRAAVRADRYLANSTTVRDRIKAAYGIDADVVPPPHGVDASAEQEPVPELVTGRTRVQPRGLPPAAVQERRQGGRGVRRPPRPARHRRPRAGGAAAPGAARPADAPGLQPHRRAAPLGLRARRPAGGAQPRGLRAHPAGGGGVRTSHAGAARPGATSTPSWRGARDSSSTAASPARSGGRWTRRPGRRGRRRR